MSLRSISCLAGALLCSAAWLPAGAQAVYKCGYGTYSQKPCSPGRVVNTDEAPVPARRGSKDVDVRRTEQNRALAQSLRRMPDETAAQFETRRRRARLLDTDRQECARLDTRMPVEKARMNNPDPDEVAQATAALEGAKKRFRELRC
jgi:hypothetical protein